MSYEQVKEAEAKNKQRILEINPSVTEDSGIYIFHRIDENGIKHAYVGQAKHLLTRLAKHLAGYVQYIDLSIRAHGLFDKESNPTGYQVKIIRCHEKDLHAYERMLIKHWSDNGYQLKNKTAGGQDKGKAGIAENKPSKTYREGVKQGYENARREVKHLFDLHLNAVIKANKPHKTQEKALQKFYDFLEGENNG